MVYLEMTENGYIAIGATERPQALSLLVVDDNELDREILALTLGAAFPGADIRRADQASIAMAMCKENNFDCVLTDFDMPDMDGLALAVELKAIAAYLPIILLSSVGDEVLAVEALRSGISDYIPKSRITAASIRRTVDRSITFCAKTRLIDEQRSELENFAYALAHDFKQPIRQISTFAKMISEEIQSGNTDEIHGHLAYLAAAAHRLGKLVEVMSQYTLLNQPPKLGSVDLNLVLSNLRSSLAPYLCEKHAVLVTPERAPVVQGNEALITQVLQNLILNAIQYNSSKTPRVAVTVKRRLGDWIVQVKDNGLGIEAKYLAEIFKPLIRLHTASEYPGSGLGLTLARKAVLAQKGSIWCESTPGKGSVFHIQLPAAAPTRIPTRNSDGQVRMTLRQELKGVNEQSLTRTAR